jgi:hypothetical protein
MITGQSWSQTAEPPGRSTGTIVAAGFGYQIGDVSTITVKVYDAVSGEVLSEDTFELNVKEEGSRSHPGQERIFAGGVGLGAANLSNFVLRVYDAKTGKFQWEGQLNLTPGDGFGGGEKVSTLVPRRADIMRIHSVENVMRQPSFLLRALDSDTGSLVWEDEFSTDTGRSARMDRIVARLSHDRESAGASRTFDLSIRMFTANGHETLWEDKIAQGEPEADIDEAVDDHAQMLPGWPGLLVQTYARSI